MRWTAISSPPLVRHLNRRVAFSLSVTDEQLYLEFGAEMLEGHVQRHSLPDGTGDGGLTGPLRKRRG